MNAREGIPQILYIGNMVADTSIIICRNAKQNLRISRPLQNI